MRNIAFFIFAAVSVITTSASAAPCFDEKKIKDAIGEYNQFYGDVGSSVDCHAPKTLIEKLICQNSTLKLMEQLDTKAFVYAYENATKSETDHKKPVVDEDWIRQTRNQCKTEACLCKAFIEHTTDSAPSRSPYAGQ